MKMLGRKILGNFSINSTRMQKRKKDRETERGVESHKKIIKKGNFHIL